MILHVTEWELFSFLFSPLFTMFFFYELWTLRDNRPGAFHRDAAFFLLMSVKMMQQKSFLIHSVILESIHVYAHTSYVTQIINCDLHNPCWSIPHQCKLWDEILIVLKKWNSVFSVVIFRESLWITLESGMTETELTMEVNSS